MKAAVWLLWLCSLAHGAACPTGQARNEATLVEMENTWARVLERHDMPGLECILATEFEEAGTTGQLTDRSHLLAAAAGYGKVRYQLSELHARVYGDFGYVRGAGVALTPGRPPRKTRFTDIFVYRDGRWQCVAGHESRFAQANRS
jgi:Domain of unknown function (DUF4440)